MASSTPLADQLAQISQEEFQRYLQDFRPTESATIADLDKSTVAESMNNAQGDAVRSRAALERMRERYGTNVSAEQAAGEARQNALSGTLNVLNAGNTAVIGDRDTQRQSLSGLLNVGQGIRQQALGTFGSASQLEGQRTSANASNQAAYKQQQAADKANTYSQVAALGMTAAVVF